MKHTLPLLALLTVALSATAQLKPRPDAIPPAQHASHPHKTPTMAESLADMADWNRYPTYQVYTQMMQQWASTHPHICTIDTIGSSIQGRLILAAHIHGNRNQDTPRPQFFYSSSIHGDELTGYIMMLRLIDTLLSSYGSNQRLTDLVNQVDIYINPLANPDGAYFRGNNTVQGAIRHNAHFTDLNRAFPDPFSGTTAKNIPTENQAMIDYVQAHSFRLSANIHDGSEVLNYPWDSFSSNNRPHPHSDWWIDVCKRFVDTCRLQSRSYMRDLTESGYIAGGDWYVIHGGRQDYMNHYHNCLELTLEISTDKTPDASLLPAFWQRLNAALLNYIEEIHSLPGTASAPQTATPAWSIHPNPASNRVTVTGPPEGIPLIISDIYGRRLASYTTSSNGTTLTLDALPAGTYIISCNGQSARLLKH